MSHRLTKLLTELDYYALTACNCKRSASFLSPLGAIGLLEQFYIMLQIF